MDFRHVNIDNVEPGEEVYINAPKVPDGPYHIDRRKFLHIPDNEIPDPQQKIVVKKPIIMLKLRGKRFRLMRGQLLQKINSR